MPHVSPLRHGISPTARAGLRGTHSQCSPDGVRDAVLAAFQCNAEGVILSRKYSEMKLTALKGARTALQQLHLPT